MQAAEDKITSLMSQLSVRPKSRYPSGIHPAGLPMSQAGVPRSPGSGGDSYAQWSNQDIGAVFIRSVVEQGDSKEYLGKLCPEAHLIPSKHYESINFREVLLGMSGVHQHLVNNSRPTQGYELHTQFILRKSVSFLYTNSASVLYEKYVKD